MVISLSHPPSLLERHFLGFHPLLPPPSCLTSFCSIPVHPSTFLTLPGPSHPTETMARPRGHGGKGRGTLPCSPDEYNEDPPHPSKHYYWVDGASVLPTGEIKFHIQELVSEESQFVSILPLPPNYFFSIHPCPLPREPESSGSCEYGKGNHLGFQLC